MVDLAELSARRDHADGDVHDVGDDRAAVMRAYDDRASDHIRVLATPNC